MSMQWIRDHYPVPAKRGGRIRFMGQPGRITSTNAGHLVIHLDGQPAGWRHYVHPCWRMDYLDGLGER